MDYIRIKNLEVFTKHGIYEEDVISQKFAIDADLYFDTREAGVSDDIRKSVDYSSICHFISAFMKGHNFKLIETAAERLADDILIQYPTLDSVALTVKKPWAPIGLPIEEVSVTIVRGWHKAFLSLGSNMGDKEKYICDAINIMNENEDIEVVSHASIIETEPYGNVDQDKFLNTAIEIKTLMTPRELLTYCKNLEKMAERVKTEHWGPRTLDIDILFYDNDTVDRPGLTIPHEDMANRDFVLRPMMEIAPYHRHPVTGKTIRTMFAELNNK